MANIVIDVAAEFTGKRAFDQASKSTNSLEKSVNKLGKRLISVYAAQKLIRFGAQTAKAFAQDEAAAQRLTSAVNNLGLGFADLRIKQFVADIEEASGVLDDSLRPALQALLLTTGSVIKSQELLKLSIDIAAGSGQDLETVANDLAQAYVGNTKGLKKYYLGLTQAELKAASFTDIQQKLNKQFSGANAYYLTTYAGQMSKLQVASANAQETIGKGLVEALAILGGNGGIDTIVNGMKTLATLASNFMQNMAIGFRYIKAALTFDFSEIKELNRLVEKLQRGPQIYGGVYADKYKAEVVAAEKAAEAKRLAQIKADKKIATAKIAADKLAASNAAKLAKAQSIFDIDKIQIEAALKGKISDDEKLRLELQRAILNEDYELADKLQKRLEASQRATAALQGQINAIKPPVNPFADMVKSLEEVLLLLGKVSGSNAITTRKPGAPTLALEPEDLVPEIKVIPEEKKKDTQTNNEPIPVVVEPSPVPSTNNPFAGLGGGTFGFSLPSYLQNTIPQTQPAPVTVNVTVEGSVISQNEMTKVVADALIIANTEGLVVTRPGGITSR